jgi:hypothetical protein
VKLVILESPFNAATKAGIKKNIKYARACVADCFRRGEAAFGSHLLYTQEGVLDDKKPEERKLGMNAGFEWTRQCAAHITKVVVYTDRGVSAGMEAGIANASASRIQLEFRRLGGSWAK